MKSACENDLHSCQDFFVFLPYEVTRNITTLPGWDACPSQPPLPFLPPALIRLPWILVPIYTPGWRERITVTQRVKIVTFEPQSYSTPRFGHKTTATLTNNCHKACSKLRKKNRSHFPSFEVTSVRSVQFMDLALMVREKEASSFSEE